MLRAINIETAAHILFTADERNAENLRERCMQYILLHFDEVSKTHGFERMGHTNVALGEFPFKFIHFSSADLVFTYFSVRNTQATVTIQEFTCCTDCRL